MIRREGNGAAADPVAPAGTNGFFRGGPVAEQYRALRAVIEASEARSPSSLGRRSSLVVEVVGVEHAVADVGIRLAAAFADGGRSTLLIDADLRATSRHRLLRPGGAVPIGLSEWLRSERPDRAVPAYPSGLANVQVLPAGSLGASDEDPLASEKVSSLVETIRRDFERVVVIAAPLNQAADALFIAPHVDGVLLVVAPGRTHGPAASRARDALRATGARLYGVVLGEAEAR